MFDYLVMALDTMIIVAFMVLFGTIITALGKPLLERLWPENKEDG